MAGRLAYMTVTGAAIVAAMVMQGDLDFNDRKTPSDKERHVDRVVDRVEDRAIDRSVARAENRRRDVVIKRDLSAAIGELARAEGTLIALKFDDATPASEIEQAQARRDAARDAVERLSEGASDEGRAERDAVRATVRESLRSSVPG